MPDAPEVPEAKNPFERRVAVTVAILVVFMALFANRNDNAKTEAILATTRAANQWSYFQAKSVKEHTFDIQRRVLERSGGDGALAADFAREVQRYGSEKDVIRHEAEALEHNVRRDLAINDRCDQAVLILQLATVLCSLAILVHWRLFWFLGILLGLGGVAVGASSFLIHDESLSATASANADAPAQTTG